MSDRVYDRDWYARKVADPDSGEPVHFQGGALEPVDFELDALYYGVEHENRRRELDYRVRAACALVAQLAGIAGPVTSYRQLDSTAWLELFDALSEPHNLPSHMDPANAVNFRLDVLRAMAKLPRSWRRALIHRMDGYQLDEIASLMGWLHLVDRYEPIRTAEGTWFAQVEEPNVESAERVVRNASSEIRAHCSMDIPSGKQKRRPKPDAIPTSVINDVEAEITDVRSWRSRELARRDGRTPQRRAA